MPKSYILILGAIAIATAVAPIRGQQRPPAATAADYARAESFLAPAVVGLVVGGSVAANWIPDDPSSASGSSRAQSRDDGLRTSGVIYFDSLRAQQNRS